MNNDAKSTAGRVWDLPLRLFHWSLAGLTIFSIVTGHTGQMEYHQLSGYAVLALVAFRIAWGFAGSHYSRFSNFEWAGLVTYLKYLLHRQANIEQTTQVELNEQAGQNEQNGNDGQAGQLHHQEAQAGHSMESLGHNPAGSISIVIMLLLLLVQAVTGLFANDDIFTEGPLAHLVSEDTSDLMSSIHHTNKTVLYVFLGLHLFAVLFHELYKRERLLLPMITGRKQIPGAYPQPRPIREFATALAILAVVALGVWLLVTRI